MWLTGRLDIVLYDWDIRKILMGQGDVADRTTLRAVGRLYLVLHCAMNGKYSICLLRQHCVVISQG